MFYKMIERARDQWYASPECAIGSVIDYIVNAGQMRDAQIDAIKTYLYLKIGCECKPLEQLFQSGAFNTADIDSLPLSIAAHTYLNDHPAAAALLEYAMQVTDSGEPVSAKLAEQIKASPADIDYGQVFHKLFYGVSYTDYLFSLPMGAGKTYLMAAFIYLDLYFAMNEPANRAFAHNFIIFAPSGLKSSVVPSLRTIQRFDPTWVLPEPAASDIRRTISFEVLDQGKTANKSNKTKNPNVQKIANHQPISELFGLVAVTNAEKVILDRVEVEDGQLRLREWDDDADRQANELRNLIGKLPALSIFIDEVHHAVTEEIKLRAVVNHWAENRTVNSVIGFSGTPYLEKSERIAVTDTLKIASGEISNIVYYYPLIDGVGNFLKRPIVKIEDVADSARIIENGVRSFLDTYKDTVYADGTTAKLGIYCGTIEKLEQLVAPLVTRIAAEYGLGADTILKFHKGNKQYPQPQDSQWQFDILDQPISRTRIILLVQIGKEGWDCRSLTGIILSQEGDCPKNMVLQTSCRCLRQVVKGMPETALIYLNDVNAAKLNEQLQKQHHITLKEFSEADNHSVILKRYDRTKYLKLPRVDFYQLKINYETMVLEAADPDGSIPHAADDAENKASVIRTTDLSMDTYTTTTDDRERGTEQATFFSWMYGIARSGLGAVSMDELLRHESVLRPVYETITYERDGARYYSSKYDRAAVEANIRKAFCDWRSYNTKEELIPEEASLLNVANFRAEIQTSKQGTYYPPQNIVEGIIKEDKGQLKMTKADADMVALAESSGYPDIVKQIKAKYATHPNKDHSFHYLPYHTDSSFEQTFLKEVLTFPEIESLGLEVYYNGDRAMTEFKIKCYKSVGGRWQYIGMYTPDFLILQRKDGRIHKVVIVETKGGGFAESFRERREFMAGEFLRLNNEKFGYQRFEFLYLEDSLPENDRLFKAQSIISAFFMEGKSEYQRTRGC